MFQMNLRRSAIRLLPVLTMLVGASVASAALFTRDVPTQNLNACPTCPADRSNAALFGGNIGGMDVFLGDDFVLGGTTADSYGISSLTVWVVGNTPVGSNPTNPANGLFTLYGGPSATGVLDTISSSNYSVTRVIPGGQDYLDLAVGGTVYPIYQITFSGLNWNVVGDTYYNFGVDLSGAPGFALYTGWASKAGGTQDGADDRVNIYDTATKNLQYNSAIASEPQFPTFNGWNNVSDVSVIVDGAAVPEPATVGLIGLGLIAVALKLRRK